MKSGVVKGRLVLVTSFSLWLCMRTVGEFQEGGVNQIIPLLCFWSNT